MLSADDKICRGPGGSFILKLHQFIQLYIMHISQQLHYITILSTSGSLGPMRQTLHPLRLACLAADEPIMPAPTTHRS